MMVAGSHAHGLHHAHSPPHVYILGGVNMGWHAMATGGYPFGSDDAVDNAQQIRAVLTDYGWSLESIAGVIGNIQAESGLNPWRWQNDNVHTSNNYSSFTGGYGLFQFSPASKYISSSNAKKSKYYAPNFSDSAGKAYDGASQCIFVELYGDYQPNDAYEYNYITYEEYKVNAYGMNAFELAGVWYANFERGSSTDWTTRGQYAIEWFSVLYNLEPDDEEPPGSILDDGYAKWGAVRELYRRFLILR